MFKKISSLLVLLFAVFPLVSCNVQTYPTVQYKAKISPLTEKEFSEVGGLSVITKPKKEDFKRFVLDVTIKNDAHLKESSIEGPNNGEFKKIINTLNKEDLDFDRYWFGSNRNSDSEYHAEIVFYARGLKEEAIRNVFGDKEVKVRMVTDDSKNTKDVFSISDSLVFQ